MINAPIKSNWARFAFIALAILWLTTGWFILLYGGFYSSHKYSQITTFVDGLGAIFMAYLFLLLATVALAVVLQSFAVRRNAYVALGLLIFLPPCSLLVLNYI
ncbi:MAG: hypothetical protein PXX73_05535 [Sideroxydans sp.]|nr:hypothetical protein [Sideroxydans sp.]